MLELRATARGCCPRLESEDIAQVLGTMSSVDMGADQRTDLGAQALLVELPGDAVIEYPLTDGVDRVIERRTCDQFHARSRRVGQSLRVLRAQCFNRIFDARLVEFDTRHVGEVEEELCRGIRIARGVGLGAAATGGGRTRPLRRRREFALRFGSSVPP